MMNLLRPLDRLAGWWLDRRARGNMAAWEVEAQVDFRLEELSVKTLPDGHRTLDVVASARDLSDLASRCATVLRAYNAENFVTWTIMPRPDHGTRPVEIVIRYLTGKPVGLVLQELTHERARLRARLEEATCDAGAGGGGLGPDAYVKAPETPETLRGDKRTDEGDTAWTLLAPYIASEDAEYPDELSMLFEAHLPAVWTCIRNLEFSIATLRARLDTAVRERDLAIAHDRQPYPTAWSYEQLATAHAALQTRLEEWAGRALHGEAYDETASEWEHEENRTWPALSPEARAYWIEQGKAALA